MKIAVLAAADTWHFLDLQRAAGREHELVSISFDSLSAAVGSHGHAQFHAGEIDLQAVDAVVVRTMPAGSLQQIVLRMDILGSLARRGTRVVNDPKTIEMSVDKYLTLARLAEQNVPVPRTVACESVELAEAAFRKLGQDVVVKPLFGSMGQGIERLQDAEQASQLFRDRQAAGEVLYLQQFIDHGDWDLRLLVIGQQVFGMKRNRPGHWLTNIQCGATGEVHTPTKCEQQLALKTAAVVGAEFAGVDLIYDTVTGKPVVVEVNAAPGWRAISGVLQLDVAAKFLEQIFHHI